MGIFDKLKNRKSSRRRHPRVEPDNVLPITVDVIAENIFDSVNAKDISIGGIAIRLFNEYSKWKLEDELELNISFPGNKNLKAVGIIKNKTQKRSDGSFFVGIIFTEISDQNKIDIQKYVDSQTDNLAVYLDDDMFEKS